MQKIFILWVLHPINRIQGNHWKLSQPQQWKNKRNRRTENENLCDWLWNGFYFTFARRKFFTLLLLFVFPNEFSFFFASTFLFIDKISINIPVQVYFDCEGRTERKQDEKYQTQAMGNDEVPVAFVKLFPILVMGF